MKRFAWMLLICFCVNLWAQENSIELNQAQQNQIFKTSFGYYQLGKYQTTIEELKQTENLQGANLSKSQQGLIAYWKGLCYNRIKDFENASIEFSKALGLDYSPVDINYEYGQALYASEKLAEARLQFRESLRKKFKRAVSLYYIAYLSNALGEKKKAISFYKAVDKLSDEEAKEIKQAAEMQIADIYLEQVEKHPDAFRAVESTIIPQYREALAIDPDSILAQQIERKIRELQLKYDLILLKLRNGRPTLQPPYFMRVALDGGVDSNVTFSPKEQEVTASKQSAPFLKTDAMGRYTFYQSDYFSFSPEIRFNYTKYFSEEQDVYRNDNYLVAPAVRTSYEHELWKRPASFLVDYDFNQVQRDIDGEKKLTFASRSHTFMLGERFNYFSWGESILRLRRRQFDSYEDSGDSTTTSLVFEQIRNFSLNTLLLYASFDMLRVRENFYDSNSQTIRADFIFSRFQDYFTPSIGFGLTLVNPYNNTDRGLEYLLNPNLRLSKTFGKSWRGNLKADFQDYSSKDTENYAYQKYTYSFELEYLF
jgi:tetratricopeptide (TPR) repeat protein